MSPAAPCQYEDFEPKTEVVSDNRAETFLVHVPEFKKEQLRVQLTPSRILRISGERPLASNKWTRFMKEVSVPQCYDAKDITAKLEGGVLSVRQPKSITPVEPQEIAKPAVEAPKPQPAQSIQPRPAPATTQPAPALDRPNSLAQMLKEKEDQKEEEEASHKAREDECAKPAEADTGKKHEEERRDKEETGGKPAVAERWTSERVLKEMKNPGNLKMLAVVVVVATALHVAYGGVWYTGQRSTGMDMHSRKVVGWNYEQTQDCYY